MTEESNNNLSTHQKVPDDITHIENTDYEVGQDNIKAFGMDIHNPVFIISAIIIIAFVLFSIVSPDAKDTLEAAQKWSISNFNWLFMISANFFLLFCIGLIFSPFGKIRLGGKDAKADFSYLSWLAMLFAAGMGIGLMFWGTAEPVVYFTNTWDAAPLGTLKDSENAKEMAMAATIYHWGFHAWAIYAVVALSLAFFTFNRGMPLTIRSAFYPIFGERVWGWTGHIIDIFAVFATIFGLATSLGFGAQQAASGLNFLFDIPSNDNTQVAVIAFVTSVAVVSVVRGLDGGVKILSNINMGLALILLVFVAVAGLGISLFSGVLDTSVAYIKNIVPLSNWVGREDTKFYEGWSVFYWAWWLSWSPFVGIFIARISKGRSIREFLLAVLLIPTFVTIIWMTAFGGNAIDQIQNGVGKLASDGMTDASLALFYMYENMPMTNIISFISIILVLVFFVTSSDSGSLVIDSITSGGKLDAPIPQRIFWAVTEGAVAAVLLFGAADGEALGALKAGAITTGLPFAVILILMCISTTIGLVNELKYEFNAKK